MMTELIRDAVKELCALGSWPQTNYGVNDPSAGFAMTALREELLDRIRNDLPITDEEARALITLFHPNDDYFGLAIGLVQVIETAPSWPLWDCLGDRNNMWIDTLVIRYENWLNFNNQTPE